MKKLWIVVFVAFVLVVGSTLAFGMKHEASAEKGKALFNDAKLGTAGNTCGSCHPDGKGLEASGTKTEWRAGGKVHKTLEDAINLCITMPLKGKALDVKSKEMQSMVMYIKSLGEKKAAPAKKKAAVGC